jgi:hypothetical protein
MSVLEEVNISLVCRQSQLGFLWPESECIVEKFQICRRVKTEWDDIFCIEMLALFRFWSQYLE